ncbi:leucyl aminopeptidase [Miltoncostaea marina]|uniref:leucyl aminopeptidase n=1 Tax=Miltoncostaea marina TaxID=2843215 RepID=UPI001C3E5D80|nr:leucyl aminopeptidase [Miltoncostaea marina]
MRSSVRNATDLATVKGELLVVCVPAEPSPLAGPAAEADAALDGAIARSVADGEVKGEPGSLTVFHAGPALRAPRVAVVGVGEGSADDWRAAGRAVASATERAPAKRVALVPPPGSGPAEAAAFVEGLGTGLYRFRRFKSGDDEPAPPSRLMVHHPAVRTADVERADRVVAAVNGARDLVNTPGNHLTPTMLAAHAERLAAQTPGLECTVLGRKELEKLGAGALLAVAQGSDEPPRMIVLRYRPETARPGEVLGLVGKAVTFDSGGISIKPSNGMEEMKMDMGGGAAVIEGTALIAALGLPVEVLAVVPSTENLPSGRAVKPGDVVTAMNGRTVEVINTDAEGRLILADALTYAARQGATRMIDFATLTGAIVVALGEVYAGLFGSDEEWTATVRAAGEASGDLAWPMPMHERYAPLIESTVADLTNSSNKRQAGPVYAAQFLREFTEGLPWCHLDVAGTAMTSAGGTGFGVRLALAVAERLAGAPAPPVRT